MITVITEDWQDIAYSADGHYFAIADVHGRADLLEAALVHADGMLPANASIVLLGDLIDRGPDSLVSLDLAMRGIPGREVVSIAGNHESMLLHTLASEPGSYRMWDLWLRNGGTTVLSELHPGTHEDDISSAMLVEGLGEDRIAFLNSMRPHFQAGGVLFVHAGIHPERDLSAQLAQPVMDIEAVLDRKDSAGSMRWIRKPWVGHSGDIGCFIIYGHTILDGEPLVTSCQAGIDLGAYETGVLCAAEISGRMLRFHRLSA